MTSTEFLSETEASDLKVRFVTFQAFFVAPTPKAIPTERPLLKRMLLSLLHVVLQRICTPTKQKCPGSNSKYRNPNCMEMWKHKSTPKTSNNTWQVKTGRRCWNASALAICTLPRRIHLGEIHQSTSTFYTFGLGFLSEESVLTSCETTKKLDFDLFVSLWTSLSSTLPTWPCHSIQYTCHSVGRIEEGNRTIREKRHRTCPATKSGGKDLVCKNLLNSEKLKR